METFIPRVGRVFSYRGERLIVVPGGYNHESPSSMGYDRALAVMSYEIFLNMYDSHSPGELISDSENIFSRQSHLIRIFGIEVPEFIPTDDPPYFIERMDAYTIRRGERVVTVDYR